MEGTSGRTSIIVCSAKCQSDIAVANEVRDYATGVCSRRIEGKINLGSLLGCKMRVLFSSSSSSLSLFVSFAQMIKELVHI